MGATLAPVTPARHHLTPFSVDLLVACRLGVGEATAHNYLYDPETGVVARAEKIAETLTVHGHTALRDRLFGRLRHILDLSPPAKPVRETFQPDAMADADEDREEVRYLLDPCPATRDRYLSALYKQRQTLEDKIRAFEAEKAGEAK